MMPAPFIYGALSCIITDSDNKNDENQDEEAHQSHIPMGVILYSVLITASLAIIIIQRKKRIENSKLELIEGDYLLNLNN